MGCATGTVKYLLFAANLLFALTGLTLLSIGIVYLVDVKEVKDGIPEEVQNLEYAPIFTIVIGSIIFFISFMGCCGAIKESTCLLNSFTIVLLSIFIIQIAIGVFAFLKVKDTDLKTEIEVNFKKLISRYNSSTQPSKEAVDFIQAELKCCGASGKDDYLPNMIPRSCCEEDNAESPCFAYEKGCTDKLYDYIWKIANVLGYVVIGTAVIEIVSSIFALCLSSSIKNQARRRNYT